MKRLGGSDSQANDAVLPLDQLIVNADADWWSNNTDPRGITMSMSAALDRSAGVFRAPQPQGDLS